MDVSYNPIMRARLLACLRRANPLPRYAKQLEKALQEQLRKDHPLFGDIEPLLEE